jgi:DNA-binding NarL/FixJ family response regulator
VPAIARVDQVVDGREALNHVALASCDIVLMDIQMPEIDGLQTMVQIKARWPQTKVVALSVDPSFRDTAIAMGADRFIAKDRIVPDLEEILRELFAAGETSTASQALSAAPA